MSGTIYVHYKDDEVHALASIASRTQREEVDTISQQVQANEISATNDVIPLVSSTIAPVMGAVALSIRLPWRRKRKENRQSS